MSEFLLALLQAVLMTATMAALIFMIRAALKASGTLHDWEYRNPYDRTCRKCGRVENQYGDGLTGQTTWEQMLPEPHSPERCINPERDYGQ